VSEPEPDKLVLLRTSSSAPISVMTTNWRPVSAAAEDPTMT
jgi:hypothetical protein